MDLQRTHGVFHKRNNRREMTAFCSIQYNDKQIEELRFENTFSYLMDSPSSTPNEISLRSNSHTWSPIIEGKNGFFSKDIKVIGAECVKCGEINWRNN